MEQIALRQRYVEVYCVAGKKFGLGHLSRAQLIVRALREKLGIGASLTVGTHDNARGLGVSDLRFRQISPETVIQDLARRLQELRPTVAILDLPWSDSCFALDALEEVGTEPGIPLIGIDGPLENNSFFELVFVPSFFQPKPPLGSQTKVRSGWDCYLLQNRSSTGLRAEEDSVLVATGGSDVADLGRQWPELLSRHLTPGTRVTWIQGPLARPPMIPDFSPIQFRVVRNPSSVSELMGHSAYGLSVHGVSLFEMLASGLAAVTYSPYGERDRRELSELGSREVVRVAEDPEDAVIELREIMDNPDESIKYSRRARQLLASPGELAFCEEVRRIVEVL